MAQRNQIETPSSTADTRTTGPRENTDQEERRNRLIQNEVIKFLTTSVDPSQPAPSDSQNVEQPKADENVQEEQEVEDFCTQGEIIGDRFQVLSKFREGGYGQIYKAYDTSTKFVVALKVEKLTGSTENMESHVLKRFQNRPHCPYMFGSGTTSMYTYTALQLLGKSLSDLRKLCLLKPARLSVSSSIRSIYQCLEAIESLHNIGFLHRDIKPSNFAIGSQAKDRSVVYMLDFGLARYYLNPDGSHRAARKQIGFRGTIRYASINTHRLIDLSRRDDLWSLFYSFYELMIGKLHWRKSNDKKLVLDMKLQYSPEVMCRGLPKEMVEFINLIKKLKFEDQPYYDRMYTCLKRFMKGINSNFTDSYDWQVADCRILYHWFRLQSKRT